MADPAFRKRVQDMGTSIVRMPGGSWSSSYDWLGCETSDGSCVFNGPARPSDYVDFLSATGLAGMWTVSINATAQEAAGLVAFFNGSTTDTSVIGVDRNGTDWKTVGTWAALRAAGGHPDPQPIDLWEVGNEVYGAKPATAGGDCFQYGWEDAWTCDGSTYVTGDAAHDGYAAVRAAMLRVDPSISIGAVGIPGNQSEWGNFGNEVIDGTRGALDFYVVHDYGFGEDATDEEILRRPIDQWNRSMRQVRAALDADEAAPPVPVMVTEYNVFSNQDLDEAGAMAQDVSAFFVADTIGQMAVNGVVGANQWNLINGATPSGADYGIFDAATGAANPEYWAINTWSQFGDAMLPTTIGFDQASTVSAYAGVRIDGTVTVIVLNKSDAPHEAILRLEGAATSYAPTATTLVAPAWDSKELVPTDIGPLTWAARADVTLTLPARSITLLSLRPSGG